MTWVIGGSTMFGYGFMISDIRVSWGKNGPTADCLQKIYFLGNDIFGGFAGSVQLGFMMLQDLRNFLKLLEGEVKDSGWYPDWVAENWYPRAKEIFIKVPKELRDGGCEIILVGASPDEDVGIPGFAKIYIAVLRHSLDFKPKIIIGGNNVESIGNGAGVEMYKEEIKKLSGEEKYSLMQSESGMPGGYGHIILHCVSDVIRKNPDEYISKHLHIALIRRGQYSFGNNDTTIYYPEGMKVDIQMPPVAKNFKEFIEAMEKINLHTEEATC